MSLQDNEQKAVKGFADRLISALEEKAAVMAEHNEDIAAIRAEAKEAGFNTKVLNMAIKEKQRQAKEKAKLAAMPDEQADLFADYCHSIGVEG